MSSLIEMIRNEKTVMELALVASSSLARLSLQTFESSSAAAKELLEIIDAMHEEADLMATVCVVEGILNCGRPEVLTIYCFEKS